MKVKNLALGMAMVDLNTHKDNIAAISGSGNNIVKHSEVL
jgi:hypothetical protein